jgi:hypothetical protein
LKSISDAVRSSIDQEIQQEKSVKKFKQKKTIKKFKQKKIVEIFQQKMPMIVFFVFAVVFYFFHDSEFKTFVDFFESSVSWAEKNLVLF